MNINIALALFLLVIVIYAVIICIFTVLLRVSGIPRLKARFQVVSLLTNSGYTTSESEIMLLSPFRRKMCTVIMLFGYIFSATIISMVVNLAMTIPNSEAQDFGTDTVIIAAVFAAAIIIFNIKPVKKSFEKCIEKWCLKKLAAEDKNRISLLDNLGDGVLARIYVKNVPAALEGKLLADVNDINIKFMLIKRGEEEIDLSKNKAALQSGDFVLAYGALKDMINIFEVFCKEEDLKNILFQ